jgi:hypothetical protein
MEQDEELPPKPPRQRHDGFTPVRQKKFFKALNKTGCIADACRACGISRNTVRRHRDKWPAFDARVEAALAIASVSLEMIAWKRATEGAEEKVYRDGKLVMTRVKPSDAMLRLLMQGANPKKYGRMGQMPRRATMKQMRKEARREAAAKVGAGRRPRIATNAEVREALTKRLAAFHERVRAGEGEARLASGWTRDEQGNWIPPGWVRAEAAGCELLLPSGGDDGEDAI